MNKKLKRAELLSIEFRDKPQTKNPTWAIELKIISLFNRFWYKENKVPIIHENTPKNNNIVTKFFAIIFKQKIHFTKKIKKPILGIIEKTKVALRGAPSYTSGAQKWKGAQANLNKRTKTTNIPA